MYRHNKYPCDIEQIGDGKYKLERKEGTQEFCIINTSISVSKNGQQAEITTAGGATAQFIQGVRGQIPAGTTSHGKGNR